MKKLNTRLSLIGAHFKIIYIIYVTIIKPKLLKNIVFMLELKMASDFLWIKLTFMQSNK
jgi:hypothetical protein